MENKVFFRLLLCISRMIIKSHQRYSTSNTKDFESMLIHITMYKNILPPKTPFTHVKKEFSRDSMW